MPFPKIDDIKRGDKLIADGGFTCIDEDEVLEVMEDEGGLYVFCRGEDGLHGPGNHHYLEGQVDDDDGACVGFKFAPKVTA